MKRIHSLCLFFILALCSSALQAQSYSTSIDLTFGYVPDGFGINSAYNFSLDREQHLQVGALYAKRGFEIRDIDIPLESITITAGYLKTFSENPTQPFKVNLGGGILGGYEVVNNGKEGLSNGGIVLTDSKFIYGGFLTGELTYYITDDLDALMRLSQYYHANSDAGNFETYFGIGVRLLIF